MNFLPEHSPLEVRDIARTLAAKLKGLSKIFNYSNICENVQSGEIIGKLNILWDILKIEFSIHFKKSNHGSNFVRNQNVSLYV